MECVLCDRQLLGELTNASSLINTLCPYCFMLAIKIDTIGHKIYLESRIRADDSTPIDTDISTKAFDQWIKNVRAAMH